MPKLQKRSVLSTMALVAALFLNPTNASAQFGALGNAARRAQEELKNRQEAEAKAKAEADAKAKAEAEAKAKAEADAKAKEQAPAPAAAPAQPGGAPAQTAAAAPNAAPAFEVYSKFDFVPGEKVVGFEDFTQDAIGDFPARWNTNASAEIVTISGQPGRWLKLARAGWFTPEFITDLPENVTVEFDLTAPPTADPGFPLATTIVQLDDLKDINGWQTASNNFQLTTHISNSASGTSQTTPRQDGTSAAANTATVTALTGPKGKPVHIAMWRQRQRMRVYINEEKVWDLPRAISTSAKFNSIVFFIGGGCGNCDYYIANLRVATGAPDTRNKIITQGKWVTHGILFDVNSDRITPQSYGTLKEIAGVLTENADLKVQIVGHTDADGDDAANLDLSKRRAASVKAALAREFKIDAGRMETDGKGEGEPVDKNDNITGKANNRRVEFVKK